jgi:hypothetical protein
MVRQRRPAFRSKSTCGAPRVKPVAFRCRGRRNVLIESFHEAVDRLQSPGWKFLVRRANKWGLGDLSDDIDEISITHFNN